MNRWHCLAVVLATMLPFAAQGCGDRRGAVRNPNGHGHGHDHGNTGEDHAGPSGGEAEGWSVTAWGEHFEIFPECDPLIAGQVAKCHTHVTLLPSFAPLREGEVSAVLRSAEGAEQVFRETRPVRDGIFSIAIQPQREGAFDLMFRMVTPGLDEEIPAGRVRVGSASAPGSLEAGPPPPSLVNADPLEPSAIQSAEPISFLKEQQWRTEFATEWVRRGTISTSVRGSARTRPAAGGEVLLSAPLDGTVAGTTRVHVGLAMKQGATVMRLTPRVGSGRSLAEIEGELATARARLSRLEELLAAEAVSQAEVEGARARVAALEPELAAVRRGAPSADGRVVTESAGANVQIRAPFAGRLAEVLVVPGQAVSAGDPLVRLVKTEPVWIEVALRPSEAAAVTGDPVGLNLLPAGALAPLTFQAEALRLVSRAPQVDRRTGAVTAIIEVRSGIGSVPLGTSAEAEILLAGVTEGVVIPVSAVIDDGGVPVVYVQIEGERFARQEVRVRARQGASILVDGLAPGLRLVTKGGAAIRRAALVSAGPGEGHVH